ncbi:HIT domain-containing protein [Nitratireductor basaltis]|uniref:HIT family hydrolase, diadenosine tetraphosphate hydrolase n=1 Tax=Nitratireductor basaltis TaxID=472175 RepID=A0A084UEF5_9HYPH|nr:HIT family protein [Nitratireductor basaltis]KFB11341.1 HIT family hydrolase, diadenosine tetraphosphate hydrolase [Nitratireductor basaltis]
MGETTAFQLDDRLARDSHPVSRLDLCELRLANDSRWPWLILVPMVADAVEIHDLREGDQLALARETAKVAQLLKKITGCTKINSGALGNVVRQLHVHVVARNEGDPGWPGPIWGHGKAEPYDEADRQKLIGAIRESL